MHPTSSDETCGDFSSRGTDVADIFWLAEEGFWVAGTKPLLKKAAPKSRSPQALTNIDILDFGAVFFQRGKWVEILPIVRCLVVFGPKVLLGKVRNKQHWCPCLDALELQAHRACEDDKFEHRDQL